MISKEIVIGNSSEAVASPAGMLVQVASKYDSSIYIEQAEKKVNAKSIMGVMTLGFLAGRKVTAVIDGSDEEEALAEIEKFLAN